MQERDERISRIRARAYQIWEQNGQPEGTHEEDWRLAAEQIDAEMGDTAPMLHAETGDDASPPHPTLSGGSESSGTAFADPFESRRSDASAINETSPQPAPAGRAKARKSL